MQVIVTGSRSFENQGLIRVVLDGLFLKVDNDWTATDGFNEFVIIEGGARGADSLASSWARSHSCYDEGEPFAPPPTQWESVVVRNKSYPADWTGPCDVESRLCQPGHRRVNRWQRDYCPTAGLRRNLAMLKAHPNALVVGFLDKPEMESTGTHHMLSHARAESHEVWVIECRDG